MKPMIRKLDGRDKWSKAINEIREYVLAIEPKDSATTRVTKTTSGTFVEVAGNVGAGTGGSTVPRWG